MKNINTNSLQLRVGAGFIGISLFLLNASQAIAADRPPPPPPPPPPASAQPVPQPLPPPPGAPAPQPLPPPNALPPGQPPPPPPGYAPQGAPGQQPPPGYPPPPQGYYPQPGQPAPGAQPGYPPPGAQPGYPPPGQGGYPPPGYYPYYYPPPGAVPSGPPTMPYKEGDPIPDGYRIATEKGGRGLTIAGISVFGGAYFLSLLAALSSSSGDYAGLYIPVIGPWITLGTSDTNEGLNGILVLDGLTQAAGATMFIIGMATGDKKVLKRNDVAQNKATPEVFIGPKSAALRWTF